MKLYVIIARFPDIRRLDLALVAQLDGEFENNPEFFAANLEELKAENPGADIQDTVIEVPDTFFLRVFGPDAAPGLMRRMGEM